MWEQWMVSDKGACLQLEYSYKGSTPARMKAPSDSGEWGVEGKRGIKHPDKEERGGGQVTQVNRSGGDKSHHIQRGFWNRSDLNSFLLVFVCVDVREKKTSRNRACKCFCGVWAEDWSSFKAHLRTISRLAAAPFLAGVFFFLPTGREFFFCCTLWLSLSLFQITPTSAPSNYLVSFAPRPFYDTQNGVLLKSLSRLIEGEDRNVPLGLKAQPRLEQAHVTCQKKEVSLPPAHPGPPPSGLYSSHSAFLLSPPSKVGWL